MIVLLKQYNGLLQHVSNAYDMIIMCTCVFILHSVYQHDAMSYISTKACGSCEEVSEFLDLLRGISHQTF